MLLIGSRALAFWYPDFGKFIKEDTDWDIISDPVEVPEGVRIEWHRPLDLNNEDIAGCNATREEVDSPVGRLSVCHPLGLKVIKRSHLWRDWKWDKHIAQYYRTPLYTVKLWDLDKRFLEERTKLTKKAYPQGNPSLNQTNEDFFDDSVKKVYDHDWIHELVAYPDNPMYTRLKNDFSKAWCEKGLWDGLTEGERDTCVSEETHVIACERFCIPSGWTYNYNKAYYMALKKVCTTLTSGWFRDWAIDRFPQVWELRNKDTFDRVKGLTNG